MYLFISNAKQKTFVKKQLQYLASWQGPGWWKCKLEHLPQQIAHKASFTPRSGHFSLTAELHWQFCTRVIQPGEFLISFLTVGQTFWRLTHSPPGGLGLLSSEGPNEVRDVYCQHVPPAGKPQEESVQDCAKQHNCSWEYTSVRTGGVAAHSKDLIYTVIVLSQIQHNISLSLLKTPPEQLQVKCHLLPPSQTIWHWQQSFPQWQSRSILLNLLHLLSIKMKT